MLACQLMQKTTADKLMWVWGGARAETHRRREAVKDAMKHSWNGYKKYAW